MAPATLGTAVHAYHGSGSDDDDLRSRELQGIHDILRRHVREGVPGSMSAAQHLHEGEARRVMRDPLAMLMMSRGVPLGISLKVQQDQQQEEEHSEAEEGESSQEHRCLTYSASYSRPCVEKHPSGVALVACLILLVHTMHGMIRLLQ